MSDMQAKIDIKAASKKRMKLLAMGDKITNICAGNENPQRLAYFVELKTPAYKNPYGISHKTYLARCTDKKGKFWETDIDVIYPEWLNYEECKDLFEPVWQANFG